MILFDTYQRISVIQGHLFGHRCAHIGPRQLTALPKIALSVVAANATFCPNQQRLLVCQPPNSHDPDEGRWAEWRLFQRKIVIF